MILSTKKLGMNTQAPISKIMSTRLITVLEDDAVSKVHDIFTHNQIHHVLVTDVSGKLAGIISKQDLLRQAVLLNPDIEDVEEKYTQLRALRAHEIMTKNPMSLEPDDTIGLAADIFLSNKFHALPVIEGEMLVGIVTTHDLLRFAFDLIHTSM